jgi:uncharacterized protein YunC (DUF1805 family)
MKIELSNNKNAEGYVVDFGPVKLVFAKTDKGVVGCGIIDVATFEKFNFPAVKVKADQGSINSVEDLLKALAIAINSPAKALGISEGMTGKEALEKL